MSVSPAPSDDQQVKTKEQITFRFCRECSNMLYPKEDRNTNKLMFACRTCQFSEEAQSSCVFRNNLYNTVGETAGVTQDVGSDPTVGLPGFCTLCGQEVVCFICGGLECIGSIGFEEIEDDDFLENMEMDSGYESTEKDDHSSDGSKNS